MSIDSLAKHLKDAVEEIAKEGFTDYKVISKAQEFTGDNYAGDIIRVEIRPSKGTSLHLILKTAMGSPQFREVMPMVKFYKNETYCYTTVLPAVQKVLKKNGIPSPDVIRFAKFYKSISEEFKEAIIMKDMSFEGYVLHDKKKPFSHNQAESVIKTLARLHAASFVMKERDPGLFSELSKNIPHTNNYSDAEDKTNTRTSQAILRYVSHIECPTKRAKVIEFATLAEEKLLNILDSKLTEPYNVICHGDCWNNNFLFKYEEEKLVDVLLIDWQIVRIASPTTDLSYLMFVSMDAEYVETNMEHLLDLYYLTLQENLSIMGMDIAQCYPREIFSKHFKRSLIFGFIMAAFSIPLVFPYPKDAQKIEDIVNDLKNGEYKGIHLNDFTKKRYNNLINYAVNNQLI